MLAIAEHAMGLLMAAFTQAEEASASLRPLQKVEAFGHAYIDWAFDNPTHLQILWTRFIVDASQSELVVQQSDISLRMWSQLFKDAKLQGDLAADADEELIAFSTRCHLFGLVRMWTDGDFYAEDLKSNPRSAMKRAFSLHVASLAVTSND
jgi:AcrR family transcriptional regulator